MSKLLTQEILKKAQSQPKVGYGHDSRDYERGKIYREGRVLPDGVSVAERWVHMGGGVPWVEVMSTGDIRIVLQGDGTPPKSREWEIREGLGSPEATITYLIQ